MDRRKIWTALAATTSVTLFAACSSGGDGGGEETSGSTGGGSITVWTTDTLPDRVAATEDIIAKFTDATGIEVELVGVPEDQFNQVLTSSAAAGDLPDVIGSISLAQTRTLAANELANNDAHAAVIDELGEDTFVPRALELTRDGDQQLSVPSDFWAQLLFYRTDLFEAAGLDAPETYDDILAAAKALNSPEVVGFVGANKPGEAFTQQTFEHVALGNGCQMVDESGKITIASDACVAAFEFYGDLLNNYSVQGGQDVDTVRASYFAGQAAMFIWSTFVLDEMAGLRNDAMPSCPQCADDPAFLAKNTGVVPAILGPDGDEAAQFGEITNWVITASADADPSQQFVTYMMSDGYVDWTAIAPEGKVPVRLGTQDNPTEYSDTWATLPVGVDTKAPLSDFYSADVLEPLQAGPENMQRWAITQGQGDLIGAAAGEQPVAAAVSEVTTGGADPKQAAEDAAASLQSIQDSLG
ncbi:ABC transporter substrate-binding protein [Georgenia yuyongxinii]|uniref:Extracellular solute-binding protein n=1 Tax=Georgenia yuyongxinii TaxID=2589797 RepID=A0A552WX15_9MICO|nr:extracellular solute-binding protein [Georgenia yuyongxinii]TRW47314.1 extracellular solute-binding protein [Georgenia yuyongxinii]